MTAKEYLGQAYRLDQRINADLEEVARLREMANSISSPSWEEKPGGTRPTEPHWVRCIYKIIDLERHIDEEVDKLVELKKQIRGVIDAVPDKDEQTVLRYPLSLLYALLHRSSASWHSPPRAFSQQRGVSARRTY